MVLSEVQVATAGELAGDAAIPLGDFCRYLRSPPCDSTDMGDLGAGDEPGLPTRVGQPAAEIHLLVEDAEVLVEQSHLRQRVTPKDEARGAVGIDAEGDRYPLVKAGRSQPAGQRTERSDGFADDRWKAAGRDVQLATWKSDPR